ncbi:hypothetical protein GQ44DRAFT_718335, partial [Phaeosphaeriaceae sp. PMI808]
MENPAAWEAYAYEVNFLRNIRDSIQAMHMVSDQKLNIEFIVMTAFKWDGRDNERRFTNLLETIRKTIYELMYSRKDRSIRVIHHDATLSAFPRDLTRLWSLTSEQWQDVCFHPTIYLPTRSCTEDVDLLIWDRRKWQTGDPTGHLTSTSDQKYFMTL